MKLAKVGSTVVIINSANLSNIPEGSKHTVLKISRPDDEEEVWMQLENKETGSLSDYFYEKEDHCQTDGCYPTFKVVSGKWWKE